ncbi:MAG: sialate O-acetylesterase [Verrucomicrobiae bacterium]|nr:sialate O-acetylesterase [Verrucomicrobiae bacterium]
MKLPSIFSDHMVLQQGRPVPVWGWAGPGEKITVTFAGQTVRATAARNGRWQAMLFPLKAGGPFDMTITGINAITLHNVLVGEVWICSGQSNMEWPVKQAANAEKEIAAALRYSRIRLFKAAKTAVVDSQQDVHGRWDLCHPETLAFFSAVGWFFGRELFRHLDVPIGLINVSWGGTIAEAWTSREALLGCPLFKKEVLEYERKLVHFAREKAAYDELTKDCFRKILPADPGNVGFRKGWALPEADISAWKTMDMPRAWQADGLNFSGVLWFRKEVQIPAKWAGRDLVLNLAPCDKHDTTYFNNQKVGGIGLENSFAWCTPRSYVIPGRLVRAGLNTIAVRIYSFAYAGGMLGPVEQMSLRPVRAPQRQAISLAGSWQYQVEHNFGLVTPPAEMMPKGPGNPNSPYALYRGMIEPLIPFAIRGAIWYQGESNAERAKSYRTLFPLMIQSWRQAWNQGCFPFHFVQLANHHAVSPQPVESDWAELREAQTLTLRLPRTGMAVTIDIGDAQDIHPINKQDVGKRLALAALHQDYGFKKLTFSGPIYRSVKQHGNRLVISFDHVGKGLTAKGGKLKGFAIAADDRKFVWANAKLEGTSVVVWNDQIDQPVAVRYAWADNPVCNLYNKDGLPASPFRTDRWPGRTK